MRDSKPVAPLALLTGFDMPSFDVPIDTLVDELNENLHFTRESAWVDTSIVVTMGSRSYWLKIYKGRVIDSERGSGSLGYSLELSGTTEGWQSVALLERSRLELGLQRGLLQVRGDQLAFLRLWPLVAYVVDSLVVAESRLRP